MTQSKDKRRRSNASSSLPSATSNKASVRDGQSSAPASTGISNSAQNKSLRNSTAAPQVTRSTPSNSHTSNAAVKTGLTTPSRRGAGANDDIIELDEVTITGDASQTSSRTDGKSRQETGNAKAAGDAEQLGGAADASAVTRAGGEAASAEGTKRASDRAVMRFVSELAEPITVESPAPLPAMIALQPLPLLWQVLTGIFPSPAPLQFDRFPQSAKPKDRDDFRDAARTATEHYQATASIARQEHDRVLNESNSAIQSVYNQYYYASSQLVYEFQRSDSEIESTYQMSVSQVFAGAEAADQIILNSYAQGRGALAGALASSKTAITNSETKAKEEVPKILTKLGKDFVDPILEAKKECEEKSGTAQKKLQTWKTEIPSTHADTGGYTDEDVKNEAVRLVGPKLAEKTLKGLAKATKDVVFQFDRNKELVEKDISDLVRPSLDAYTATIEKKGHASVQKAFNQAFGALKKQADQARRANAESHSAAIDQLHSLRRAERERLEQQMSLALTALHNQAETATVTLFTGNARALPNYSSSVVQLNGTLLKAAQVGPNSLRNVASDGSKSVAENLGKARNLQLQQIAVIQTGVEQGFQQHITGTSQQLAAAFASAAQYFGESSNSSIAAMLVTAEGMTQGFSSMAIGVTAAAQEWTRPLEAAFAKFLSDMTKELDRGKTGFNTRLNTIGSDFTNSVTRQGNPSEFFAATLTRAQNDAVAKVTNAKLQLGNALGAGLLGGGLNNVNEAGVGGALRQLTPIQGGAVKNKWGTWKEPYNTPFGQQTYINKTGSQVYTLEGHLKAQLGEDSADYNAAINYLQGNTAAGARFELEASTRWYNDQEERIEAIMRSLNKDQLEELRNLEGGKATLAKIRDVLDGTDLKVFEALEKSDYATADVLRMRDELNEARRKEDHDALGEIVAKYTTASTPETWGGEVVNADERRQAVQRAFVELQGQNVQALGAQAQQREEAAWKAQQAAAALATGRPAATTTQAAPAATAQTPPVTTATPPTALTVSPTATTTATAPLAPTTSATSTQPVAQTPAGMTSATAPMSVVAGGEQAGQSQVSEPPPVSDRWMKHIVSNEQRQQIFEAQAASQAFFDYATRDIEETRSVSSPDGHDHDYTVTLTVTGANREYIRALIFFGAGTPEAKAALLGVEVARPGKPNIVNVDKALVDPRLSPNLQYDVPDPVERARIVAQAEKDRERMMQIFARNHGGWTPESGIKPEDILARQLRTAFGSDTHGADLAELLATERYPSPKTAALAVRYAVHGRGTNEELIDRTIGRMNRDEIAVMRKEYLGLNTGESLDEALGTFGNWGGDLSGDERLRAERMLLGVPRNDRERAELAAFTIQQQHDETGVVGGWLASGSIQEQMLQEQEAELKKQLGGEVKFVNGQPHWSNTSAFGEQGQFLGNTAAFLASTEGARVAAENYSSRIDQYANAAATTIAIIGAVAAAAVTILTGGAASPLLLGAIALATGLTSMAAQTLIKGGRYGWEQAALDLGMTAVQALTAGLGQSLALASRGGMAAVNASMRTGLSMSAARQLAKQEISEGVKLLGNMGRFSGSAFLDKVLIGMGTGGFGAVGSAAISEQTWAKGGAKGIENLFAAAFRGMLSGGFTAGVTNAIEDLPLKKVPLLGDRLGRLVGGKETFGEAIGASTSSVSRGAGKALTSSAGAFAGRAAELGFESARGEYKGDAGDILIASAEAAGLSALQSFAEGGVEARAQAIDNARQARQAAELTTPATRSPTTSERATTTTELSPEQAVAKQPSLAQETPLVPADQLVRPSATDIARESRPTGRAPGEIETRPGARRAELEPLPRTTPGAVGEDPGTRVASRTTSPELAAVEAAMAAVRPTAPPIGEVTRPVQIPEIPGAVPFKEGAAAAMAGSEMQLGTRRRAQATPQNLHAATTEAVSRATALAEAQVSKVRGGLEVTLPAVKAKDPPLKVQIRFGETIGGDVASFRPRRNKPGEFIVTLSRKANPETYARAIAHELGEIRIHAQRGHDAPPDLLTTRVPPAADARLSAHDHGRLAELEVLAGQLADAKRSLAARPAGSAAIEANVTRLQTEIDSLSAHLGLLHSDSTDPRYRAAVEAIGAKSPAAGELTNARQRAAETSLNDALQPARHIDETTRLSPADRKQLAALDDLAARAQQARFDDDTVTARQLEHDAIEQLGRLGLLDADMTTDLRVRLASSVLEPDSPALRLLNDTRATAADRFAGTNDALRPGFAPDARTVLSDNDRARLGIVSSDKEVRPLKEIIDDLMVAEAKGRRPDEIKSLGLEAEGVLRTLGLVEHGDAASIRARLVTDAFGGPDTKLSRRILAIQESALERGPTRAPTVEAPRPQFEAAGADAHARLVQGRPGLADLFDSQPKMRRRFDAAIDQLHKAIGGLTDGDHAALTQLFQSSKKDKRGGVSKTKLKENIEALERLAALSRERPGDFEPTGQARRQQVLEIEARRLLAAYEAGHTDEPRTRPIKPAPQLDSEMNRIRTLIDNFKPTGNRLADALALRQLHIDLDIATRTLRTYGEPLFNVKVSEEADIRDAFLKKLFRALNISDTDLAKLLTVRASGIPGESIGRDIPGTNLQRYLRTPKDLGNLKTRPRGLAKRLQALLADYHLAHLVGPGFGDELFQGIMLAPKDFNLKAQNQGIETIVRALAGNRSVKVDLEAIGTRLAIPLARGGFEHVDILRGVKYVLHIDGQTKPIVVEYRIGAPPNGGWHFVKNDIPGLTRFGIDPELLRKRLRLNRPRR